MAGGSRCATDGKSAGYLIFAQSLSRARRAKITINFAAVDAQGRKDMCKCVAIPVHFPMPELRYLEQTMVNIRIEHLWGAWENCRGPMTNKVINLNLAVELSF